MERYKIHYDNWFYESSLHESGYVKETVDLLAERGWTYEKDGALWLNTTQLLKEKYLREGKTQEQVDKLDLKDDVLRRAAEERGIRLAMLSDYYQSPREAPQHVLVVNYTGIDTEKLPTALARLAELWPS